MNLNITRLNTSKMGRPKGSKNRNTCSGGGCYSSDSDCGECPYVPKKKKSTATKSKTTKPKAKPKATKKKAPARRTSKYIHLFF